MKSLLLIIPLLLASPLIAKDASIYRFKGFYKGTLTTINPDGATFIGNTRAFEFKASQDAQQGYISTRYHGKGRKWKFKNSRFIYTDWGPMIGPDDYTGSAIYRRNVIRFKAGFLKGMMRKIPGGLIISTTYFYNDGTLKVVLRLRNISEQEYLANSR